MEDLEYLRIVKGIVIMDNNGDRHFSSYFDNKKFPSVVEQNAFESNLFSLTRSKSNHDVTILDDLICAHKFINDLCFYVVGSKNEPFLMAILDCLYESARQILKNNLVKANLLENLDVITLAVEEIYDEGVVLVLDPNVVNENVAYRMETLVQDLRGLFP